MKIEKKKNKSSPSHNSLRTSLNWEVFCLVLFCFISWLLWYFDERNLKEEEGKVYSAQGSGTEAAGHVDHIHTWEAERWESSCAAQVPQRDWCHPQWAGLLPQLSQQVKPIASQKPICHVILASATLTENSNYHSTLHSGERVLLDTQEKNNNLSRIER